MKVLTMLYGTQYDTASPSVWFITYRLHVDIAFSLKSSCSNKRELYERTTICTLCY